MFELFSFFQSQAEKDAEIAELNKQLVRFFFFFFFFLYIFVVSILTTHCALLLLQSFLTTKMNAELDDANAAKVSRMSLVCFFAVSSLQGSGRQ